MLSASNERRALADRVFVDATRWYYTLSALSAVNLAFVVAGSDRRMVFGLSTSELIAEVGRAFEWAPFTVLGAFAGALIAAMTAGTGWLARRTFGTKVSTMLCIAGVVVYGLDGVVAVLGQSWLQAGFHLLAAWQLSRAIPRAQLAEKSIAVEPQAPPLPSAAPSATVEGTAWRAVEELWQRGKLAEALVVATALLRDPRTAADVPPKRLVELTRAGVLGASTRAAAATLLSEVRQPGEAFAFLEGAVAVERSNLTRREYTVQLLAVGNTEKVRQLFRELMATTPSEALVLHELLSAHPALGDFLADVDSDILNPRRRPSMALALVIGTIIVGTYSAFFVSLTTDDAPALRAEPRPSTAPVVEPCTPADSDYCRAANAAHRALNAGNCEAARSFIGTLDRLTTPDGMEALERELRRRSNTCVR